MKKIPYTIRKKYLMDTCKIYKKLKKEKDNGLIRNFKHALEELDRNELLIIENDFIKRERDREWYKNYWSANQYYKYKRRMTENFLNTLFI